VRVWRGEPTACLIGGFRQGGVRWLEELHRRRIAETGRPYRSLRLVVELPARGPLRSAGLPGPRPAEPGALADR